MILTRNYKFSTPVSFSFCVLELFLFKRKEYSIPKFGIVRFTLLSLDNSGPVIIQALFEIVE